jgi:hypothetical protein
MIQALNRVDEEVNEDIVSDNRWLNASVACLRTRCAELGLNLSDEQHRDRYKMIKQIIEAEKQEVVKEVASSNLIYYIFAYLSILAGIGALIVSIPHVAGSLVALTGCAIWVGYALAILFDVGIAVAKTIDTLAQRFELSRLKTIVRVQLVLCLTLSAFLNSQQFLFYLGDDASLSMMLLSIGVAVSLSFFVYASWLIGGDMLITGSQDRIEEVVEDVSEIDISAKLRQEADTYDKIRNGVLRKEKRKAKNVRA